MTIHRHTSLGMVTHEDERKGERRKGDREMREALTEFVDRGRTCSCKPESGCSFAIREAKGRAALSHTGGSK